MSLFATPMFPITSQTVGRKVLFQILAKRLEVDENVNGAHMTHWDGVCEVTQCTIALLSPIPQMSGDADRAQYVWSSSAYPIIWGRSCST